MGQGPKRDADEGLVIAELRRVCADTGHGEVRVRVRDGRVQLVERTVKTKPPPLPPPSEH